MKVKYSRKYGSYHAQYEQGYGNLKYNQAVILSKNSFESRALRKDEVSEIINIFVERAVDDKERWRIEQLTELELDSYQELKIYQNQDKSILPAISAILMPLWTNGPWLSVIVNLEKKWRSIRSFRFLLSSTTTIFTVFPINWMITLPVIISSLKSVISVLIVSRPFINLKIKVAFTLSPEQEDRLITDEQVRYQAFSMLSGNEWVRITFEYTGLYRDVLESDIPKLNLLEETTNDGVDKVRYEIETFSLLGFQSISNVLMEISFSKDWNNR